MALFLVYASHTYASKESELKGPMMEISIEDFCQMYQEKPDDALASLKGLDNEQAAAILIDAGGALSETSLLDDGISRLEDLQQSESESSFRSYCIANGRHLRASTRRRLSSATDNDLLNDLFMARVRHGKVLSDKQAGPELRNQSATNFGNALLETGRWVEALDVYQKARRIWPRNGVSALREMQCLMGFHNAAQSDPARYGTYSDLERLGQCIVELSSVVEDTYTEIGQLAGEQAVEQARHAVSQINTPGTIRKQHEKDSFFEFIESNSLALSLFCSSAQYENGKVDTAAFQHITDDDWQSTSVPEIFAMLNVMKADYALARQLFYEARFDDCTTIFRETVKSGDTLDYSIYGVQVSAMCSAQRIAYDILDKIAVSLSGHLKLGQAKRKTFDSFWYDDKNGKEKRLNETVKKEINAGNRGLLALYDLHRDTTKDVPEKAGFLRALKEYRNSSTHRFTVLHDENIGLGRTSGKLVDHEHVTQFEELTLSSIRLARAALFYFCDAINSAEGRKPKPQNAISLIHEVPDHDYIRGRDCTE